VCDFSRDNKAKDGYCYRCKPCSKLQNAEWYAANRERLIAQARARELANPEAAKQRKREYRERHRERVKESNRKYAAKPEVRERQRTDPRRIAYNRTYGAQSRQALSDEYVRRVMAQKLSITGSQIPQALVDAQREVMKIKRLLNEQRK
jgi:hypothetical protein